MGMILSHLSRPIVKWLNGEKAPLEIPLSDFERVRYEIKPCDVILVEGRTRISNVIRQITQSSWTHAALYIGRLHDIEDPKFRAKVTENFKGEPDVQLVIESLLGRGTIVRPLEVYAKDHVRICRPRGLVYQDSQQAIDFAISRLGLNYDIRQILDLGRFLFPWALWPRRWRSSLFAHNAGRPTHTVCSTMLAEAFAYIQFPILPLVKKSAEAGVQLFHRNPKLCTPKDFDYSPYFDVIKYPFIDCCDYGTYRLLPWHGPDQVIAGSTSSYVGIPDRAMSHIQNSEQIAALDKSVELEGPAIKATSSVDPLIEEINQSDSEIATFPDRDMPIEDTDFSPEEDFRDRTGS